MVQILKGQYWTLKKIQDFGFLSFRNSIDLMVRLTLGIYCKNLLTEVEEFKNPSMICYTWALNLIDKLVWVDLGSDEKYQDKFFVHVKKGNIPQSVLDPVLECRQGKQFFSIPIKEKHARYKSISPVSLQMSFNQLNVCVVFCMCK